ncbi:DUF6431 domain-containing protein [Saccharopolyspora sp. ASAGF58]|uniref:DUF6431 domain-containing protein n=1 Tax=Saccharopolyspora sp. ASAGF58 TaxID=2719023 RepID=UPI001FF0A61A|nr:DUF6431 domain-containing protein [Saccharopolyspora sp. ASAGF58]
MIEVVDTEAARRALAAGRLRCPECAGTLRPWGRTRERTVVDHHGTRTIRPDRARCQTCGRTHTVLPAELLAGRSYTLGVIGPALAAGVLGVGHRRIAARLRVPAGTVRSWLRRARDNAAALCRVTAQNPGSAHLLLAGNVVHLDPAAAVFESMLEGWRRQQSARFLRQNTIEGRLRLIWCRCWPSVGWCCPASRSTAWSPSHRSA